MNGIFIYFNASFNILVVASIGLVLLIGLNFYLLSPLRKQTFFTKRVVLDEIFIFRDSVMLEYQLIEKGENIAKRNFFDFECFRSGLIFQ